MTVFLTLVVTDPYFGIDYDEILVVDLTEPYHGRLIENIEPEPHQYTEPEPEEPEPRPKTMNVGGGFIYDESNREIWCGTCEPPQWFKF